MQAILSLFKDDNGNPSSLRVNSFLALICAMVLSVIAFGRENTQDSFPIISAWIAAAFAPKVVQKFAEKKDKVE
jgi:hypothetical protein